MEWNHERKPGVSFITYTVYKQGDALWINYGPKGNENLLSNYGFVITDNAEDYYKVTLNIDKRDPLYTKRMHALKGSSTSSDCPHRLTHLLFVDDKVPKKSLCDAARIMVANMRELEMIEHQLPGARCEAAMVTTLRTLLLKKRTEVVQGRVLADSLGSLGGGPCSADMALWTHMAEIYRKGKVGMSNLVIPG